jgi:hypothetical protein
MAAMSDDLRFAYRGGRFFGLSVFSISSVQQCDTEEHQQGQRTRVYVFQEWRKPSYPALRLLLMMNTTHWYCAA